MIAGVGGIEKEKPWKVNDMAYFPNGTSSDIYMEKYCERCLNWIDKNGDGNFGCPILDVHFSVNYSQCRNKDIKRILEILWPTGKDGFPAECSMFRSSGECEGQMTF